MSQCGKGAGLGGAPGWCYQMCGYLECSLEVCTCFGLALAQGTESDSQSGGDLLMNEIIKL